MLHTKQSEVLQSERFQAVSSHAELLHAGQLLQDLGHMVEVVERKAQVAEPVEGTQLLGQLAQVVAIQQERLQTDNTNQIACKSNIIWFAQSTISGSVHVNAQHPADGSSGLQALLATSGIYSHTFLQNFHLTDLGSKLTDQSSNLY